MQGRPQKSHHRHRSLREVLCLGHERGAFALGRRLDRGGDGAHGAQALRELIVKLARQMAPLLLLPVDEPCRECRPLPGRAVQAGRQRVEDLADALKLDKPKARQAARQVTARQSIEPGQNILVGRSARPIAMKSSTQIATTTSAVRPSSAETSLQIAARTAAVSVVTTSVPQDFP